MPAAFLTQKDKKQKQKRTRMYICGQGRESNITRIHNSKTDNTVSLPTRRGKERRKTLYRKMKGK
jgi:hypothetical protein